MKPVCKNDARVNHYYYHYRDRVPPTFALVGVPGGGPGPRPVEVEGPAALAVPAGGVVPALADDLAVLAGDAARRVAVALAPAAHGEVRDRVMVGHGGGSRA